MYAKNLPVPPKFDYPYQEQQRYSGSLVYPKVRHEGTDLPDETIRQVEEALRKLGSSNRKD